MEAEAELVGDEEFAMAEEPEATVEEFEETVLPEVAEAEVPALDMETAEPVSDFGDVEA